MHLSTTYYRSPFPRPELWETDLTEIAATGFDTIYLFAAWPAAEAVPGKFDFTDIERLVTLAGERGLKAIVNLCGEVQPAWIPRLHPETAMVDHMGRNVVSSTLAYINFGLMPGGCTDHPTIRAKMGAFFENIARTLADNPHILAWDCWNEMRWASQADGFVCYCEHTIGRYHEWLEKKFGSLEALNEATHRQYVAWEDVLPAKLHARNNTDVLLWEQFITARTTEDLRWRYEMVRAGDPAKPIYAHAALPSTHNTGELFEYETALGRGNDWELAKQVDAYGGSHFPAWFNPSLADFGTRIESLRSATGDKPYWIAELQGGAAGHGPQVMQPVLPEQQARWIWTGIGRGVKGVNFWAWRDERFGREAGGFGISGDDGYARGRLQSLSKTASLIRGNEELFDAYKPEPATVGVVFEPAVYQFDWSTWTKSDLAPPKEGPYPAGHSLLGYMLSLERIQVPYDVIEAPSAMDLDQYKLLILPWPLMVDPEFAKRLVGWVKRGGTLLTEPSLAAFDAAALFNYPENRELPRQLGITPSGRRLITNETIRFDIEGHAGELRRGRWREELTSNETEDGVVRIAIGTGEVYAVDSFVGVRYWEERYSDFESFMRSVASSAGAVPAVQFSASDGEKVQWRFGRSGDSLLLFAVNEGDRLDVDVDISTDVLGGKTIARDITNGVTYGVSDGRLELKLAAGGYHVIRFDSA